MEDESRAAAIFRGEVLRTWATDATPLDPRKAVTITQREMEEELIGIKLKPHEEPEGDWVSHIPRIPINAA